MCRSQSFNAPPYFDGSNYAFWKVRMRAFLCSIDESVWDAVDVGWTRPEATKSIWDKAALAAANANSKALNAIFCGVSPDEFHRISHVTITKELKMSEDESFDSFFGKLNEVVIGKFNLGEKTEDSKIVRKVFRSLPKSFRAKVTTIEENKDLDDIKVQELIGSLQTYELSLLSQRKSESLALKMINERVEAHDSLDEDVVEKDVAYLVKNFRKFLKFKNNGKFAEKGKFPSFEKEKKDFKRKDGKESQSSQGITCFECNGHGHLKKECPNYLREKGKVYATTLSDSDSSNSDSEESCDGEGNYFAFMTIVPIESLDDLSLLVEELGEHTNEESMGVLEEFDVEDDEKKVGLQETYNSLLEKSGKYARMAEAVIKKMKRAEEDYRILIIKFLELEVVQTNAKVERVSSKKLDEVLAHQKPFSNRSRLGYTGESSSATNISKEMKFVKAKEPMVVATTTEKVKVEKKINVNDQQVLIKPRDQRSGGPRNDKRNSIMEQSKGQDGDSEVIDVMKMIDTFTTCLMSRCSSRGKEIVIDVPSSPVSKRTRRSPQDSNIERFRTPLDSQTYSSVFEDAPIMVEQVVKFDTLGLTFIPRIFEAKDWADLVGNFEDPVDELVKEFYSNARYTGVELKC
uniref:CCHC-type domain-containing protein n=1 Tax=Quercus lobata TaxID=97700 RepID=A0A7N2R2N6_QUELO